MESLVLRDEKGHIKSLVICPTLGLSDQEEYIPTLRFLPIQAQKNGNCYKVEVVPSSSLDFSTLVPIIKKPIFGCLGVIRAGCDDFVCLISAISHVGSVKGMKIYRILSVAFLPLSPALDGRGFDPSRFEEGPCSGLSRLFSEGFFYCSYDWDCTRNLQWQSHLKSNLPDIKSCNHAFLWNHFMLSPIINELESSLLYQLWGQGLLALTFSGYVQVANILLGDKEASLCIISRLSCKRVGTRFLSRGIDDDGYCSNYVETETILSLPTLTFSYLIVRGSVPVFWDQQGLQLGFPRIQFTRTPAATKPAFDKHFLSLQKTYGIVHIVDLLSQKDGQAEQSLSNAYVYHSKNFESSDYLRHTRFDVYEVCRNNNFSRLDTLFHLIGKDVQTFGYFVLDDNGVVVKEQRGIFRINCLDCLDRTNIIQCYIAERTLDLFLRNFYLSPETTFTALPVHDVISALFSENGDQLSRLYAGSNAIKSSYGRLGKLTVSSFVEDVKNSARRLYSGNFTEKERQMSIDMLLGRMWGQESVKIISKAHSYTNLNIEQLEPPSNTLFPLVLQVFTWNMNATSMCIDDQALLSLISAPTVGQTPNIFVLGLQEVVTLTASQIMSADPERRVSWENAFLGSLNRLYPKQEYLLLCAHQLVGVSISIFASRDIIQGVRNVQFVDKKTGMGGIAGNKGSICVSMEILGLQTCFLVSHLTAGQNYFQERDRDVQAALQDMQLLTGRMVYDHDCLFWCGDLNYRIDLERDLALNLIREHNFPRLLEYDQLTYRLSKGQILGNFMEAEIKFAPTYKYDTGTNVYDTSDKCRIPSWTDRILFKHGEKCFVEPLYYGRVEVDLSDHKPVTGLYRIHLDKEKPCNSVTHQLI